MSVDADSRSSRVRGQHAMSGPSWAETAGCWLWEYLVPLTVGGAVVVALALLTVVDPDDVRTQWAMVRVLVAATSVLGWVGLRASLRRRGRDQVRRLAALRDDHGTPR